MKATEEQSADAAESRVLALDRLCPVGGMAALILIIYSLATIVQLSLLGGQPGSAAEAFNLLQHHRVVGLLRLDLPTILALPFYYLLFLGLSAALFQTDRAQTLLSAALAFAGVTLVLATPTALSMIPLSEKYAVATSETAKAQLLAAGETILASDIWHSTGAIVGAILLQCGAVLISVVMLRSRVFGKATAYVGVVTHGLDLAHIVFGLFMPAGAFIFMAIAGPLYPVWFFLVGKRLFQLPAASSRN